MAKTRKASEEDLRNEAQQRYSLVNTRLYETITQETAANMEMELRKETELEMKKNVHYCAWPSSTVDKRMLNFSSKSTENSEVGSTYWSPKINWWVATSVNAGALIRSHPFYWDMKTNELKPRSGVYDMVLWGFNISLQAMYFAFIAYQSFFSSDSEAKVKLLMTFCTIFCILPLMCQIWLLKYARTSLPDVIMQGFRLIKGFHKQIRPVVGSGGKILEIRIAEHFLAFIFVGFQLCALVFSLLSVVQPNQKMFPSSIKTSMSRLQPLQYLLSVVAFAHYTQSFIASLCMMIFPLTWMTFTAIAAINGMCHSSAMQGRQSSQRLLRSYREVQILVIRFFSLYESFLVPAGETMLILTIIYAILCAFRLRDAFGSLIGAIGLISYVILVVLFRAVAEIQVRSEKLLRQWRRQCTLDRRTWRYLRNCKCALGSFGFIDPGLVLTATDIIVSNVVSLLLVIRNK